MGRHAGPGVALHGKTVGAAGARRRPLRGPGGRGTFARMFGKVLIAVVALLVGWLLLRTRMRGAGRYAPPPAPPRPPSLSSGALRQLAYVALAVLVAGTGLYLYEGWAARRVPVLVRVINANTGATVTYRARRADVVGRSFLTLDGRRVTLADVERMELEDDPGIVF
jgi:hypothetical protein